MKLPKKIQIVDSLRSPDSMLRFDNWEGYDSKKQMVQMANKINQVLDFLAATVEFPNETPQLTKLEGDKVVHEHEWIQHAKLGNKLLLECAQCGETMERLAI